MLQKETKSCLWETPAYGSEFAERYFLARHSTMAVYLF